jgi:hypothetical protein
VLNSRDGVEVRVEGEQSYGRAIGGEWQTIDNFADAFAPGNDLMAYLAGASNLQRVAAERSAASSYTGYSFDVDGPAFATYLRNQLERDLAQKGTLPAGLSLDSSNIYRGITGQGQVWIDERGLPLRLTVHVVYPQQQNGERVEADIKTDFSGFPPTVEAKSPLARWMGTLNLPRTPRDWQQAGAQAA